MSKLNKKDWKSVWVITAIACMSAFALVIFPDFINNLDVLKLLFLLIISFSSSFIIVFSIAKMIKNYH